jgi:FAD/FMN-containing dehydrogenase
MSSAARTRALTGTVELRLAAATDLRRREREQQHYLARLEQQQDANLAALTSMPRLSVAEGAASSAGSTWTPVEIPLEYLPDATRQNLWVQVERRPGYRDARMVVAVWRTLNARLSKPDGIIAAGVTMRRGVSDGADIHST